MEGPLPYRTLRDLADALAVDPDELVADDPSYESPEFSESTPAGGLPSTFPGPTVALIGRENALGAIGKLLRSADVRLVTLSGPGGIGKTHLALRAVMATETAAGVPATIVSLANCANAAEVASALAHALGLRERDEQPLRTRLFAELRLSPRILLLDNLEQALPSAATLVADLNAACPGLKLLVTSRARLRVRGEHEYIVPPLQLPDSTAVPDFDAIAASPAVQLFVQRARAVVDGFQLTEGSAAAVADVCRRLDGLPLAIELAAARARAFTPDQMLRRLEQRFQFLTGSARDLPPRHTTMHAAIAWSFDLLDPKDRALFRQLAIFAGGFTIDAAEHVMGSGSTSATADSVISLLDQSVLTRTERPDGTLRFGMLETIRDYALEQLRASGELDEIAGRHLRWIIELAEEAEQYLFGAEESRWLARLDLEHANARSALTWAIDHHESESGARLASALTDYWYLRGYLTEGRQWLDQALTLIRKSSSNDHGTAIAHVRAAASASQLAQPQGDLAAAVSLAEEGLESARRLGFRPGIARALVLLANLAHARGDFAHAELLHRDALALFRDLSDAAWVVVELNNLGVLACERKDPDPAEVVAIEARALASEMGDTWGAGIAARTLGDISLLRGFVESAALRFAESLQISQRVGNRWGIANSIAAYASLAVARNDMERAIRLFASANALYDQLEIRVPPPLRPDWTDALSRARTAVGDERFYADWAAGLRLTTQEAIDESLARIDD